MFSKQEAAQLKTEFWTAFGKSFPESGFYMIQKSKIFLSNFMQTTRKQKFL